MSELYVDTSAVLRPILESGTSAEIESKFRSATVLVTSRLSMVEAARAVLRFRQTGQLSETKLADAARQLDIFWMRCDIFEISPEVCRVASQVAPTRLVRSLDAIHLATFVLVRQRVADLEFVTADRRLLAAAEGY